jgi:branched-chain amino acid transport system permease protein
MPALVAIPVALVLTGAWATVMGTLMMRLGHFGAAFTTMYFAFVLGALITGPFHAVTGGGTGLAVPPLVVGGIDVAGDRPLYFVALAVLAVVVVLASSYANSSYGRALRVLKQNERVAAALGIHRVRAKVAAFVFSAMVCALSGVLLALSIQFITPDAFSPGQSITLFTMAAAGGLGSIGGPILGGLFVTLIPQVAQISGASTGILYAVLLLLVMTFFPEGLYGLLERLAGRVAKLRGAKVGQVTDRGPRPTPTARVVPISRADHARSSTRSTAANKLLTITDVEVRYGALKALRGVSLQVDEGSIHGLLGPNGAGKTTLLDAITGLVKADVGQILVRDVNVSRMSPQAVRRCGVSRTFQHPSLVPDLTARENVMTGLQSASLRHRGGVRGHSEAEARDAATVALELVGVPNGRHERLAMELTLAEQKIVDLARAVVSQPELVLLDEPTAGLWDQEIRDVQNALLSIHRLHNVTIMVISHDIGFITQLADYATALDYGTVLASGTPAEVLAHPAVQESFLGGSVVPVATEHPSLTPLA